MAAIMNGIALHGGFIPYGGTFLTFSRLRRNAHAHGGADEAAHDPCVHPRFDRPGRGRPDAPERSSTCRQPAPDSRTWMSGGRATRLETRWPGQRRSSASDGPDRAVPVAPEPAARDAPIRRWSSGIRRGGYVLSDDRRAPQAVIVPPVRKSSLALEAQAQLAGEGIAVARRLDAVHRRVRPAGRRLPRAGAAARLPAVAIEAGAARLLAQVRRPRAAR